MTEPMPTTKPSTTTAPTLGTADELAEPRKRIMLPVSFGQWDRLKERIGKLGNQRIDYVNYVTGAWGICVPCVISFLIYAFQTPRPAWPVALYGSGAVASALLALGLRRFQNNEKEIREEDAGDIVSEMTTIEEAWLRGETRAS